MRSFTESKFVPVWELVRYFWSWLLSYSQQTYPYYSVADTIKFFKSKRKAESPRSVSRPCRTWDPRWYLLAAGRRAWGTKTRWENGKNVDFCKEGKRNCLNRFDSTPLTKRLLKYIWGCDTVFWEPANGSQQMFTTLETIHCYMQSPLFQQLFSFLFFLFLFLRINRNGFWGSSEGTKDLTWKQNNNWE